MFHETIWTFLGISAAALMINQGSKILTSFEEDVNACLKKSNEAYTSNLKKVFDLDDSQCNFFFLTAYTVAFMNENDIYDLIGIKDDNVDIENTAQCICKLNFDRKLFKSLFTAEINDFDFHIKHNERILKMVQHIKNPDLNYKLNTRGRLILENFMKNVNDYVADKNKSFNFKTAKVVPNKDVTMMESIIGLIPNVYQSYKDKKREQLHEILRKEFDPLFEQRVEQVYTEKMRDITIELDELLEKIKHLPLTSDFDSTFETVFKEDFAEPAMYYALLHKAPRQEECCIS